MSDTKQAELPRRKGHADLTQGPILRTLLTFSIPTLVSNVLQTLGGTINTIWVGQLIGDRALAATANANMVMFLIFAFVFGFGMAATVKVGQYFGAHDYDAARRIFGTGTGFCAMFAIVGGLAGWLSSDWLLHVLSTPPAIHQMAREYLDIIFLTMPFGTVSMMVSMSLRGAGDAKTPLYAMILTTVLGIALNPVLILGLGPAPQLGIAGSALANAIASFCGVTAMITYIYWHDIPIRLKGRELRYLLPLRAELAYVLGKGLPMGGQMAVTTVAGVIMFGLVNREGIMAAAAYGACLQIWSYIQMPAFAISTAVSAMVAQNVGAGRHERVEPVTMAGVKANILMTGLLAGLLLLFDGPLLSLFLGAGSKAIPIAEHVQVINTWSYVLVGITMVLSGTMRSYGAVVLPLIAMVVSMYPARLGFYALAYPHIGAEAVWWAFPAGSVTSVLLTWLVYTRGGWRQPQALMPEAVAAE
ncbi:MAG: MATE family efflux transporter [Sphingomonadales bacterium]|nr:MATE family efflux transporter [Sphingomonadales bacterium]